MSRFKNFLLTTAYLSFFTLQLYGEGWTFLNTARIGATDFIKKHPTYDGRGVVIIILDTGVDLGTLGLTELPQGGVKIIDVQDFTGEGDIKLEEAEKGNENDEQFLKHSSGHRLFGYDKLALHPADSLYYIGVVEEKRFKNSVLPDVNNNGKEDDVFGLIAFKSDTTWVTYIDLDGDGNLQDEEPYWDYKEQLKPITFRGRDPEVSLNLATFAVNIFPDEKRINLYFAGGDHGTHVAGIAAGYKVNGQEGLNGIAPGAKIISLKIGDSRLAGGATVTGSMLKAYEYGIDFAKKYDGPVVFNMSYGIGSEIEGHAQMDLILDDFLRENESLVFCLSAGNEGPGISTIGLPAAANRALTVGAMNTKENARDVYGASINYDLLFPFSSRGGELNKPDIITPGAASSTVPPYSSRENKWGTSMAAPQATGAVALLMSAAVQQNPPLPINGAILKKAIKNSAIPIRGYLPLEQGSGVMNVPKAFEFYKDYIAEKEQKMILGYEVSTLSPIYESEEGEAAYWRFGGYYPDKLHKQKFYIRPVFPEDLSADERNNFYRAFNLKTTDPWIKINKSSTYIRGEKAAVVEVYFDKALLNKPGLYNGKVIAYRKGGFLAGNKPENKEFELMCTVVVPYTFHEQNKHTYQSGEIRLKPGELKRIYFDIPLGASSAAIRLGQAGTKHTKLKAYLFTPQGRESEHRLYLNTEKESAHIIRLLNDELEEGIWELVLYNDFRNEENAYATVKISFSGLEIIPAQINEVTFEHGENPQGSFYVRNQFSRRVDASVRGQIMGVQRINYISDDSEEYEYLFTVTDDCEKVEFELEMDADVFNLFTDFAINIMDMDEEVLLSDGLSYRSIKITFYPPSSGDYILKMVPGFAAHKATDWSARLTESYFMFKRTKIVSSFYTFYPKVKKEVEFEIDGTIPVAPDRFYVFGEIWLDEQDVNKYRTIVPVVLHTSLKDY
ncbi:MAG TPA: hypothetical protein EYP36_04635 [Calditrichaeota bacterium]|nr:hypothetical protein [Calditrichota bacterium]